MSPKKSAEPLHRRGKKSHLRLSTRRYKRKGFPGKKVQSTDLTEFDSSLAEVTILPTLVNQADLNRTTKRLCTREDINAPKRKCLDIVEQFRTTSIQIDDSIPSTSKGELDNNKTSDEIFVEGKRLVNIDYFLSSLKLFSNHSPAFGCSLENMKIIREIRSGLHSRFRVKCNMCNFQSDISTDYDTSLNEKAVLGILSIGSGYSHLKQLSGVLDLPYGNGNAYESHHDKVCDVLEKVSKEAMMEAVDEEKRIAIEAGNVINGIPLITVHCDGFWAKRSYRMNYNSLSGCAAILGAATRKVIYIGIRNKFCLFCKKTDATKEVKAHTCFKNWTGSSSSMEADIIREGFETSISTNGLIYNVMVADGDSSCYKTILESDPYKDYNIKVKKIECRNHLLRNYVRKLSEISKDVEAGPLVLRKKLRENLLRFRYAITQAVIYRNKEEVSMDERIKKLASDILNSPSHILGEHKNCKKYGYFCQKDEVTENSIVHDMKLTPMYDRLITPVRFLANHAESLILNQDTNCAEQLNAIICKHIGGKRINFCSKRSFIGRVHASVISWNTKELIERVTKRLTNQNPSSFQKKITERTKKIAVQRKSYTRRRKNRFGENKKYYGENCQKPDLSEENYEVAKTRFITECYRKTQMELAEIEHLTREQVNSPLWGIERKKRITASKFGEICCLRIDTSRKNIIESIVYPKIIQTPPIMYGVRNEPRALAELEKVLNIKIEKCGLFIDELHQFLGASPDGITTDKKRIIEVKCPYSSRNMTTEEGIQRRRITFWKKTGEINKNHKWYYQIQGQLHVTKTDACIFATWTPLGMKYEIIPKDDKFWSTKMEKTLFNFFYDCLLPELVDSRKLRNMEIRNPRYVVEAIRKKCNKKQEQTM